MRDRPNLAERLLGRLGFLLALPTLPPVALAAGALARVQKSNRVVRALLTPLLAAAVFLAFLVTVVVFVPYWVLLRIGSAIGVVDLRVPRRIVVGEIARDVNFASFDADVSLPHDETGTATAILTAVIGAIAAGEALRFYRAPAYSDEIFGPFAASPAEIEARIASFVESVDYGSSANCWFVLGDADAADLLAMAVESWDARRIERVLARASICCHVETMVDQGSHNSRVVVYGREVADSRERVAAVVKTAIAS